jgi:hypothetical protein
VPTLGGGAFAFPRLASLKELVRYVTLRGRLRLHEGKPEAAVEDLMLARQVGARLTQAEAGFVPHFVGTAIGAMADADILRLARHPSLTDRHRDRLQRIVAGQSDFGPIQRVIQREFDDAVVGLAASLPDPRSDRSIASKMPPSLRSTFQNTRFVDRADTVRVVGPYYLATLGVFQQTYLPNRTFMEVAPILPDGAPDWSEYLAGGEPTEGQMRDFLEYARKHRNLLGRSLISGTPSLLTSFEVAERQRVARARMTLVALASLRASRRNGTLAPSVDSLVRQRLLTTAPIDPFSGKPLRYDAARRLVWSVGKDAKDDGGRDKRADLVMAIP